MLIPRTSPNKHPECQTLQKPLVEGHKLQHLVPGGGQETGNKMEFWSCIIHCPVGSEDLITWWQEEHRQRLAKGDGPVMKTFIGGDLGYFLEAVP